MSARSLTDAHRADLVQLTGLAERDLTLIWAQVSSAVDARDGLLDVLPRLVEIYGAAAATLGADFYEELRADAEVSGRFTAIAAPLPDQGRTDALARWGVTPMFSATPDKVAALVLVAGGLQRIIANAARQSVVLSTVDDRRARGWRRSASDGCDWCRDLAHGDVVHTAKAAEFESHDHCNCVAAPVFD
jgi:hypothetical protein